VRYLCMSAGMFQSVRPTQGFTVSQLMHSMIVATALATATAGPAAAQSIACDFSMVPGAVWWGTDASMPFSRVVAYVAPILWYSADEPSLNGASGAAITIPEVMGNDSAAHGPVMYYLVSEVLTRPGAQGSAVTRTGSDQGAYTVNLSTVGAMSISFLAYFPTEEGLGAHDHDIEPGEFRVVVLTPDDEKLKEHVGGTPNCPANTRVLVVTRSTGKAHGLIWYWNVLDTDDNTSFPMHFMVEEGKHAFATDKNGDGIFTPGYDVNVRINDAWGCRDIIRTGMLHTGGFQPWMAKPRRPGFQVLPPLPPDSPLREKMASEVAGQDLATYELRPYPTHEIAGSDQKLSRLIASHEVADWPEEYSLNNLKAWGKWVDQGTALKSLSIAYRYDGQSGVAWVFPFFVLKELTFPLTGGYIVQRMYLSGTDFNTFGWMAMYTPSASRWLDTYLAAGAEWRPVTDSLGNSRTTPTFVFETGLKFRANVEKSPLKFLRVLTPFWGVRTGIKMLGFADISRLSFVVEVGAGVF